MFGNKKHAGAASKPTVYIRLAYERRIMIRNIHNIMYVALIATAILLPQCAANRGVQAPATAPAQPQNQMQTGPQSQIRQTPANVSRVLPPWTNDTWRTSQYPSADWYVGYSVHVIRPGENSGEVRGRAEREAQNNLAQGITVRIQSISGTETQSRQVQGAGLFDETIRRNYEQLILASTDAEIGKAEMTSFHDEADNRIYALAVVKKVDLAAYYVSRIEFYLQTAEHDFALAQQLANSDRKRSAVENMENAKNSLDECVKYNALLSAVDFTGDIQRLLAKRADLQSRIAAFETALIETATVFIHGMERINGRVVNIIVPALQNEFSKNGCRVANREADAGYVLTIEAENCDNSKSGQFYYSYACVQADLVNRRTGRSEAKINFTGPKAGWTAEDRANRKAFEDAVTELWKSIGTTTEICR